MFSVQQKYLGELGEIRLSQAAAGSYLRNKTAGIALKYVYQGAEYYQLSNGIICVGAGQMIILREDQSFIANTDQRRVKTKGICIDLDADFVLRAIPNIYEYPLMFATPLTASSFLSLSQSLAKLASRELATPTRLVDAQMLEQCRKDLLLFTNEIQNIAVGLDGQAKKLSTRQHLLSRLFIVKDYLHRYYYKNITLQVLARESGISAYYLSRLFQACFQQSPQQLQIRLRMEAAIRMLQETPHPLGLIAFRLGYHDLAAFSNQFKQYYQQSPSQWRKERS